MPEAAGKFVAGGAPERDGKPVASPLLSPATLRQQYQVSHTLPAARSMSSSESCVDDYDSYWRVEAHENRQLEKALAKAAKLRAQSEETLDFSKIEQAHDVERKLSFADAEEPTAEAADAVADATSVALAKFSMEAVESALVEKGSCLALETTALEKEGLDEKATSLSGEKAEKAASAPPSAFARTGEHLKAAKAARLAEKGDQLSEQKAMPAEKPHAVAEPKPSNQTENPATKAPAEKADMYKDGTYWKLLGWHLVWGSFMGTRRHFSMWHAFLFKASSLLHPEQVWPVRCK